MATFNNIFWNPPTVVTVPDCCSVTTPPPPPAPNLTIGTRPAINMNVFPRVGDYVVAQALGTGGVATEISGFVDNYSADGQTTVIADGETGTKTNVSTRFVTFWGPVQTVNQYPGQNIGFQNNFNGPVYGVNQYSQGGYYRRQFMASTRALKGSVLTE
ncbi:hypothetical protein HX792_14310 [Pseudomonas sp. B6002]|uniref:hypothetical protein n=1 Tax=Pseudomonas sp. B6002 TaxID=2726978 RepID=UPI0015A10966|nr:hypothetical protein [Pseudomonas sp. B6002]NVZ51515.1 hypothetical protein [Pseudomonas sp. B6002]